jgi:hypothetical protein
MGRRRKTLAPTDVVVVRPLAEVADCQVQLDQEVGDLAGSATSGRTPEGGRLSVSVNGSLSCVDGKLIDCSSAPPKSIWNEALEQVGEVVGGVCRSGPGPTLSTCLHSPSPSTSSRNKVKPWQGKLPSPRRSPEFTVGHALEKAQWRCSPRRCRGQRLKKTSSMGAVSAERLADGLNLNDFGKDASQAIFWDSHADPVLESRNVGLISACPRWNGRAQHMILSPRIPYRPTAGLASLFSRSGTSSSAARAVHFSSRGVAPGTFVEAVRNAMAPVGDTGGRGGSRGQHQSEGAGGFSTGQQQLGGAGGHVAGLGLNTDFGRGGSQPVFHPGYGGGGRPFGRRGGGQGRAGVWRGGRGASAGGRFFGGRTLPTQSRGGGVHSKFSNGGASSVMVAGQGLGGSGASSVTPQVSNAVDLLQQAITTSIGNGSAVRPIPDSTVEQIVSLLQQSVGKSQHIQNSRGNPAGLNIGSQHSSKLETIKELSTPTHLDDKVGSSVISSSKEKVPFCFRCKNKGHQLSDCNIELFCEICDVKTHLTSKCPVVRACKTFAIPCGYAVEGLGFYFIPQPIPVKQRQGGCNGTMSIVEGSMNEEQILNELKRLVAADWDCV